jgi:cytochrome c6
LGLGLPVVACAIPTAETLALGSQVFEVNCAGCHAGGGNIVRRGKNLKLKTLERNQMATIHAIGEIVTQGKGNLMSAYGEKLSPEEITAVAGYVLDRAQHDWE